MIKKTEKKRTGQRCYHKSENDSCKSTSDETFPGLFRGQFDERSFAKEEAKHVSHDIVANNHRNRNDKPNNGRSPISVIDFNNEVE